MGAQEGQHDNDRISSLGERGLIARLRGMLARHSEGLPLPTGDDVAITIPVQERLAWTTDAMIEGTHFLWYDHPLATPENLARKLVVSNVSDLASKGAAPLYALLSVGFPSSESVDRLEAFFAGLDAACNDYGLRLIGGDTVKAPQWVLNLTIVGSLPDASRIAARSNARPGMGIYVSGWPGESGAGFDCLRRGLVEGEAAQRLIARHLAPTCDVDLGQQLVRQCEELAMMDVSDGLATDGGEISRASGVALVIEEQRLPVSFALRALLPQLEKTAAHYALHGGEDYTLLFCTSAPEETVRALASEQTPITRIGRVEAGEGVWLEDKEKRRQRLAGGAFEHFR